MKPFFTVCILSCLAWAVPAGAEAPAQPGTPDAPSAATLNSTSLFNAASPFRLLDPSRLTMRQSYSVSYFSGGYGSGTIGLYMNSIGYQVAKPLYVQLDLGVLHNPGTLWGGRGGVSGAQVRPSLYMQYTPSPGFQLILDVRTVPMYYGGYGYGLAGPRLR